MERGRDGGTERASCSHDDAVKECYSFLALSLWLSLVLRDFTQPHIYDESVGALVRPHQGQVTGRAAGKARRRAAELDRR